MKMPSYSTVVTLWPSVHLPGVGAELGEGTLLMNTGRQDWSLSHPNSWNVC